MPRKKRYAPSAIDAIGTPQYPKPKQLQPYSHVGAAGPPLGATSLDALSENLMKFNRGGIRAALGFIQADQQAAMDVLPQLRETITDTEIAMSAAGDKLGIARPDLLSVMGASSRVAGREEATLDLDNLFNSEGWEDTLTKYKDTDKAEHFISALHKYGWENRKIRKDDGSKSITESFTTSYDSSFLKGLENRPEVKKAQADWKRRKDNKIRQSQIVDTRGIIRDSLTKFVESDVTVDEYGNPIPENKRASAKKKLLQETLAPIAQAYADKAHVWPTNKEKGLLFNQDIFVSAWKPVVSGAVNDINIDVDLLQEWVEGWLKLRRPTYAMLTDEEGRPTGERSKVATGSTSVVGGFKEEAEDALEELYDQQVQRRGRLSTQKTNDMKYFGDNILWPMMDNFKNGTWSQEQLEQFQKAGIADIGDINHKNFNAFINIAAEVPVFKKMLDSPEANRVGEES